MDDIMAMLEALPLWSRLFFAIAAMQGLRPAEVAGLRREDINFEKRNMLVVRSCPNGHRQETMKRKKPRKIPRPLSEIVEINLKLWQAECGRISGFVFCSKSGQPLDSGYVAATFLAPVAKKIGVRWLGLYAARRAAATHQTELTGGIESAVANIQDSREVIDKHYALASQLHGRKGQLAYDEAIMNGLAKRAAEKKQK